MALAAFDTHTFVKRLTAVGMPLEQAEVLSEEQTRFIDVRLATKDDLTLLEKDLRRKHDELRKDMEDRFASLDAKLDSMEQRFDAKLEKALSNLRQEMTDMKFALIKWIVGLGIAQTGLWFTLKLFPILT